MDLQTETTVSPRDVGRPASLTATPEDKGLRSDAIGLASSVVIAIASTGPALSAATVFGLLISYMGYNSPGMMLFAAVPIALIALSFAELDRVEPDCGTSFVWAGRAINPSWGFLAGWGQLAAGIVVMPASAWVIQSYGYSLFGADELAASPFWGTLLGLGFIVLITFICYMGIDVVAWVQKVFVSIELLMVILLFVVAFYKIATGDVLGGATETPSLSWLNPFGVGAGTFMSGFTVAIFAFWGWDLVFTLSEETGGERTPFKAGATSLVLLTLLYVAGTAAFLGYAGIAYLEENQGFLLDVIGESILGTWAAKVLVLTVFSSIFAATQATILPGSRILFSMGTFGAIPKVFSRLNFRQSPSVSTIFMGSVSAVIFVVLQFTSENVLWDTLSATGMLVAFYYGTAAIANFWKFRGTLRDSAHNMLFRGIFPIIAAISMVAAFVLTAIENFPAESSSSSLFGVGGIFILSVGALAAGVILMIVLRFTQREYFSGATLARKVEREDVEAR